MKPRQLSREKLTEKIEQKKNRFADHQKVLFTKFV
jgi:hypothetical protein